MGRQLSRYGLDRGFVTQAELVSVLIWPYLIVVTGFLAVSMWGGVVTCQLVALPFSVLGWAVAFRCGRWFSLRLRWSTLLARWGGLLVAQIGLGLVLLPWFGRAAWLPGFYAAPSLIILVTTAVLWLYREKTWTPTRVWNEGATA